MPIRGAFVQYGEFLLLKRMREAGIDLMIAGSTAAYAYGLEVLPRDLDIIVDYQLDRWQQILVLADEVEPHPGGPGQINNGAKTLPTQMHFGLGRGVDVISGFRHAPFAALSPHAKDGIMKVEHCADLELTVPIVSLEELIESWRTRNGPRDAELIRAAQALSKPSR